jgi:hypothetical protein
MPFPFSQHPLQNDVLQGNWNFRPMLTFVKGLIVRSYHYCIAIGRKFYELTVEALINWFE